MIFSYNINVENFIFCSIGFVIFCFIVNICYLTNNYVDFDISDYGLFYTLCFEGFDDCNSDDDLITSDEDTGSLDSFIVQDGIDDENDENDEGETDSDGSYELPEVESDDELEEDIHDY